MYAHVLERLGATPQESMMVGDNFACVVVGPLAFGMRAAWVNPSGETSPLPAPRPYLTLRCVLELADHLACESHARL